MVTVQTVGLLRERMSQCYRREGVNHLENCKEQVQAYWDAIRSLKQQNAI